MAGNITGTTTIEEIVENYPELIRPLRDHGIVCIRCGEPVWGTLEEVVHEKNLDLDRILKGLNEWINKPPAHGSGTPSEG